MHEQKEIYIFTNKSLAKAWKHLPANHSISHSSKLTLLFQKLDGNMVHVFHFLNIVFCWKLIQQQQLNSHNAKWHFFTFFFRARCKKRVADWHEWAGGTCSHLPFFLQIIYQSWKNVLHHIAKLWGKWWN